MRGHSNSMPRPGMRGAFMPRSTARMPVQRAPMFGTIAPMSMQHAPMRNSAFGFHRFDDRDFDRDDRFRRFHHFHHFDDIIAVDNFGFPSFRSFRSFHSLRFLRSSPHPPSARIRIGFLLIRIRRLSRRLWRDWLAGAQVQRLILSD